MIRIGIVGADTRVGAELLRILLHHPDVEIITAHAPEKAGMAVASVHHGFIGEERIKFSSNFDATALDLAFLIKPIYSESDWVKLMADSPGLKIIRFPGAEISDMATSLPPVYGLSEIYRKPLVRGARMALVPGVIASPVLVALYPLARHLMVKGDLEISISAPADIITSDNIKKAEKEISENLKKIQSSFTGCVTVNAAPIDNERAMSLHLELPSSTSIDEILKIYDSIYDDHNFTFVVNFPVGTAETEGTEKVIISVSNPVAGRIALDIVADPRMRGSAGEAVHIMNLLFSLHEKTGLNLPASRW